MVIQLLIYHNLSLNNITKVIRKFSQFNCDSPAEFLYSASLAAKRIDLKHKFCYLAWLLHKDLIFHY